MNAAAGVCPAADQRQIVALLGQPLAGEIAIRLQFPPEVLPELLRPFPRPVTLSEIKANTEFQDFELVRMGRLSVMPVSEFRWKKLLKMAAAK